jgi:hypothetical protein
MSSMTDEEFAFAGFAPLPQQVKVVTTKFGVTLRRQNIQASFG